MKKEQQSNYFFGIHARPKRKTEESKNKRRIKTLVLNEENGGEARTRSDESEGKSRITTF